MGHLITKGQRTLSVRVQVTLSVRVQVSTMLVCLSVSPPAGEVKSVVRTGQDPQGSGGEDQLPEGRQGTRSANYVGFQSIKWSHSVSAVLSQSDE